MNRLLIPKYSAKYVKIHDVGLDDLPHFATVNEIAPAMLVASGSVDTTSATGRAVKDLIRFHRSLIVISGEAHDHREVAL